MTDTPLPGQEDQPDETTCSSCGRFVGALTRCPHCGTRVTKRMSIRILRYAAVFLGTVGLGLLYLMAKHREIPMIRIGDIEPTMNFAYVRIAGTVSGDARSFKEGGKVRSLRFMVDDGTGEISVTAYRAQAQTLVDEDKLPRVGDHVEVAGSLAVTANDDVVMRLQVPDQLIISREEMAVTPLADIGDGLVGTSLVVEGVLVKVNAPPPNSRAPWGIVVKDSSGEREITFWEDTYAEIRDKILLMPGTAVRARVSVKTYRDKLQLSLGQGADLEFPGAKSPAKMTAGPGAGSTKSEVVGIPDVNAEMKGRRITVKGVVERVTSPAPGSKAPYEIILKDEGSEVRVVYWDTVATHLQNNAPVAGSLLQVEGVVDVYKDKVQLKVNHSEEILLLDVVPVKKVDLTAGGVTAIGTIKAAMVKSIHTVQGTIGEAKSVKNGVLFDLTDDSGTIKLVLWDKSIPGSERDRLRAGVRITVTGRIDEYKGSLEIVPARPQDIQMKEPAGE